MFTLFLHDVLHPQKTRVLSLLTTEPLLKVLFFKHFFTRLPKNKEHVVKLMFQVFIGSEMPTFIATSALLLSLLF